MWSYRLPNQMVLRGYAVQCTLHTSSTLVACIDPRDGCESQSTGAPSPPPFSDNNCLRRGLGKHEGSMRVYTVPGRITSRCCRGDMYTVLDTIISGYHSDAHQEDIDP